MEDLWIVIIVIKVFIPFPIAVTPRITGPPWGHSVAGTPWLERAKGSWDTVHQYQKSDELGTGTAIGSIR